MPFFVFLGSEFIIIVDCIVYHMDYLTLARFSSTCREYGPYCKIPAKQMAKREIIRCAGVYNCIEHVTTDIMEEIDGIGIGPSPTFDWWEHKWGATTARRIQATILDRYYGRPPPIQYRHSDPELFDLIRADVRMQAPQDASLVYNFYKTIYSVL